MLFRIKPQAGPQAYKTYSWVRPLATHWRPATCDEIECTAYVNGWVTTVDESTDLGRKQAHYIRHDRTRKHSESRAGGLTQFTFLPGNTCFRSGDHKLPLEREPRYLVTGGDWRGNPLRTPTVVHKYADDWVDDFSNHQDQLKSAIEKG